MPVLLLAQGHQERTRHKRAAFRLECDDEMGALRLRLDELSKSLAVGVAPFAGIADDEERDIARIEP